MIINVNSIIFLRIRAHSSSDKSTFFKFWQDEFITVLEHIQQFSIVHFHHAESTHSLNPKRTHASRYLFELMVMFWVRGRSKPFRVILGRNERLCHSNSLAFIRNRTYSSLDYNTFKKIPPHTSISQHARGPEFSGLSDTGNHTPFWFWHPAQT